MLTFKLITMDRKAASKRLGELTGIHPVYTRIPRYAYEIGIYTIDRDCNLLVQEEDADKATLQTLMDEEVIERKDLDMLADHAATQEAPAEETTAKVVEETVEATIRDTIQDTVQDAHEEGAPIEEAPVEGVPAEEAHAEGTEGLELAMEFALPMSQHTGASLRNLLNLIFSRSSLIQKATGGTFTVAEGLIEAIRDDRCTYTIANFLEAVETYERDHGPAIEGLKLDREKVTFTGFPKAPEVERLRAYGQLAVLMNKQAIQQKRIQAKSVDETNERYAMRIWLIRLGMNGEEFKQTRKFLVENLDGSMAFRTEDQADRAREKLARQRAELRAQKEAAEAM